MKIIKFDFKNYVNIIHWFENYMFAKLLTRKFESNIKNCFKNKKHNYDQINIRSFNKKSNFFIWYNKNLIEVEADKRNDKENNKNEENKNEIDASENASDDNNEIMKNVYYTNNLYAN